MRVVVVSIGINYSRQPGELKGCINDSKHFVAYTTKIFGKRVVHQCQLVDTQRRGRTVPTKANIERALRRAVAVCRDRRRKITHFVLHYSGHGTQVRDKNRDEGDRKDEALVPLDHRQRGVILDDWLMANVVHRLPPRVKFFGLIDACHSESMLDLRYDIEKRKVRVSNRRGSGKPTAMMISGCRDHRYSYDAWDKKYGASGAMTTAFLRVMARRRRARATFIVAQMRKDLRRRGYPQIPQLTASRKQAKAHRLYGFGDR